MEQRGTPAALHHDPPDPEGERLARVCLPSGTAVVIGSAQPASDFDPGSLADAGIDLVRRRSGGGAVLVAPGEQVWLDVFVPTGDVLWQDDVGKSFYWLGEVYKAAIAQVLGMLPERAPIEVNRGPAKAAPWSKVLCFAGLGAGEVTVAGDKVVGMSQRRQRSGAWIHSMALLSHRAEDLTDLLSESRDDRAAAREALDHAGLAASAHLAEPLTRELITLLEGPSNQDAVT